MKLIELLNDAIETENIIYIDGWHLGMRYNKDKDCFIWCHPGTGKYEESKVDYTGFNRVVLSGKILSIEDWKLVPLVYKYQIGDKFVLNDLTKVVTSNECYMKQVAVKPIGEITDRYIAEDDGCEYYNVKIENDFGSIIVGSHYLSQQLKVVGQ